MRTFGSAQRLEGLNLHDHAAVVYRGRAALVEHALSFFAGPLSKGCRLVYSTLSSVEQMREELAPLGGIDARIERGELVLINNVILRSPDVASVGRFICTVLEGMTREAMAAGFAGLRAFGDSTPFVLTDDERVDMAAWELQVDQLVERMPIALACAYDEIAIGAENAEMLTTRHPQSTSDTNYPRFRYFADNGAMALRGELDVASVDNLESALADTPIEGSLTIDLSGVEFIDLAALRVLADLGAQRAKSGNHLVLRNPPSHVRRMVSVLDFADLPFSFVDETS